MTEKAVNCREAGPGRGFCDMCAQGLYDQCRYMRPLSSNPLIHELHVCDAGKNPVQANGLLTRATDEIERLARERDHYKSEADNLRGLWNDPNHLVLLEGRENAAKGYAPKRTAPEHGECDDPEHVEAMRHLASIMDTEAERDLLHAALERITRIGPLGVDTYPECYRRMHAIAVEALSGEHSSPETEKNDG